MSVYVLLERTDRLLEHLYKLLPDPAPTALFDKTELAAYREQSPLWLEAASPLLEAIHDAPDAWPGLIIESAAPADVVLAHLRHILFFRFEGQRRGVLRYSHPVTASYFFTAEPLNPVPSGSALFPGLAGTAAPGWTLHKASSAGSTFAIHTHPIGNRHNLK